MYTVKQLADLAQVTARTLHYYDQIDLLKPSKIGENSYRYYDDDALLRLQQILFYREIGLELAQIKDVLDQPDFDVMSALSSHREHLRQKIIRLQNLVSTVDHTMKHLQGEVTMTKHQMFNAFSDEKQKDYERQARLQYGPDRVNESVRRWADYSSVEKEVITDEGNQIYSDLTDALEADKSATSPEVQDILVRWHQHLRYFYEPSLDLLRGLGELYNSSPEFIENFQKLHEDLPAYLQEGIIQYVDDLETAEIERLLAEDDEQDADTHG